MFFVLLFCAALKNRRKKVGQAHQEQKQQYTHKTVVFFHHPFQQRVRKISLKKRYIFFNILLSYFAVLLLLLWKICLGKSFIYIFFVVYRFCFCSLFSSPNCMTVFHLSCGVVPLVRRMKLHSGMSKERKFMVINCSFSSNEFSLAVLTIY